MSKDKGSNNVATVTERCPVADCKKPQERMHFCSEHFLWYKEGLVNKKGEKPSDFDKKYQGYMRKKAG